MKLVPFSSQYLRPGESLPFGLRDGLGRLLLAAGQRIDSSVQLAMLMEQTLFSEESESAEWHRRLVGALDQAIRQNITLKDVAAVRPELAVPAVAPTGLSMNFGEQWEQLASQLDATLRDMRAGSDWLARLMTVHARARALSERRPDASLYHMIYTAGHMTEKYSCHHALLSLMVCEQVAALLQWPAECRDALGRAALTMNVAMTRLQDLLAQSDLRVTPEMRQQIDNHPAAGAALLAEAGLGDPLCLEVVRLHHDAADPHRPLAELVPERQLARLLRRVDIFCAKISRRRTRVPMSPVQAAREACLGANGQPDEIGGALLRAVGLYPPGSFVELLSGEIGIVVARGRRANVPYVASLVSASGSVLGVPALRDTLDAKFGVKGVVPPAVVKVLPPHERLLAMR